MSRYRYQIPKAWTSSAQDPSLRTTAWPAPARPALRGREAHLPSSPEGSARSLDGAVEMTAALGDPDALLGDGLSFLRSKGAEHGVIA